MRELNYKLALLKCQSSEAKEIDIDIFTKIRSVQDDESAPLKYISLSSETQEQIQKELKEKREEQYQDMSMALFKQCNTSLN